MNTTSPSVDAAPAARPAGPAAPSVHLRAFITWLAIFPLVAIGLTVMGPLTETWHPIARAFVLTIVLVPTAVYLVVPRLMQLALRLLRR